MKANSSSIKVKYSLIIGIFIAAFLIIVSTVRFMHIHYFLSTTYSEQAIEPPIEFSSLHLHNRYGSLLPHSQWWHKWVVFYVMPLPCKHICTLALSKLQQVYKNYWKKPQLDLLVATFSILKDQHLSSLLRRHYSRVVHVYVKKSAFLHVFSHVKSKRTALFTGVFYLVNPQGKVIVDYPANVSAKVIENDLS